MGTEIVTHSFECSLEGFGIQNIALLTPQDRTFTIFRNDSQREGLGVEVDFDIEDMSEDDANTNFPAGEYTLSVLFDDGRTDLLPLRLGTDYPSYPDIIYPQAGVTDVPVNPTISWIAPDDSMGLLLEIDGLDCICSYEVPLVRTASSYQVPDGILDAGRSYVLELVSYGENTQAIARIFFKTQGTPSNRYFPFSVQDSQYSVFVSKQNEMKRQVEVTFQDDFSTYSKFSILTPNEIPFLLFSSPLAVNEFTLDYEVQIEWNEDPLSSHLAPATGIGQYAFRFEDPNGSLVATRNVTTPLQFPETPNVLTPPCDASITVGAPIRWSVTDSSLINALGISFEYDSPQTWGSEYEALLSPQERVWSIPLFTDYADNDADSEIFALSLVVSSTDTFGGLVSCAEHSYFLTHDPLPEIWEAEPNNDPSTANPIPDVSTTLAMISVDWDEDWYTFAGVQGEEVTLEVFADRSGSAEDCSIEVWSGADSTHPFATGESTPAASRLELQDGRVDVIYGKLVDFAPSTWRFFSLRASCVDPGLSLTLPETGRYFVRVKGHQRVHSDRYGRFYRIQLRREPKQWESANVVLTKPDSSTVVLELFEQGDYSEMLTPTTFDATFPSGDYLLTVDFPDGTTIEYNYSSVDSFPTMPEFLKPTHQSLVTVPVDVQWTVQDADRIFLMMQEPVGGFSHLAAYPKDVTETTVLGVPEHSNFHLSLSAEKIIPTEDMEDGTLRRQVVSNILFSTGASTEATPTPTHTPTAVPEIVVPSTDFPTIQSAIDAAADGTVIKVLPGTYFENINFHSKDIILRSSSPDDAEVVARTIIDGGAQAPTVTLGVLQPASCILEGFTIRNGGGSGGGGISADLSRATIRNNRIVDNVTDFGGGIRNAQGLIENNYIARNNADQGGGLDWCTGTIRNNTIVDNKSNLGGAIHAASGLIERNFIARNDALNGGAAAECVGSFANNILVNNSAEYGAGLYLCSGEIVNNTFFGNTATGYGGALFGCGGVVLNCIFWLNRDAFGQTIDDSTVPSYSCIDEQIVGGVGNLFQEPIFVNPSMDDFHLSEFSPCIDRGVAHPSITQDFEGDRRPIEGTSEPRAPYAKFDMGADEFDPRSLRPDFAVQVQNPRVVVQSGERPVFRVNLLATNGFDEEVTLSVPNASFTHAFSPNPALPPCSTTLLLERASDRATDTTTEFTIRASGKSGSLVREVSASFSVVGRDSTVPRLSLWQWPTRIRLGATVFLRGTVLPAEPSASINVSVSRRDQDGNQTALPSVQATTDAQGNFRLDYVPDQLGTYQFTASLVRDNAVRSSTVSVDVYAKSSSISLKVSPQTMPVIGSSIPFSGRLFPFVAGEPAKVT
ncbi:MAG TPA: right-handed parallel beta-helix repeat-containing protein, partial [bacterium]|nr:right-handed parallel beta-helix repeat-containing protein [bacterium]